MRWLLISLLVLAGCGSSKPSAQEPTEAPTVVEIPTPQEPPSRVKRFATLEEIYGELGCESTDVVGVGNNRDTLLDMGHCYQPWASLDVYLTRPKTVGSWAHMTGYETGVVGPNWVILAGSEEAARVVQGQIGGEVKGP